MALLDQEGTSECSIGFKTVQLFKDQTLGIGSYGAVCKAKCDDLVCAAKILHPTLIDPTSHPDTPQRRLHRQPSRRFELECEFLSVMRHPNIVQFLAFYNDPRTGLPVILMELMDDNLTNFLRDHTEPVSYHLQVDLCHDITKALSFLHSNDIIHRDLSGNNVLLFGNSRAKVTDFGMARLGLNPQLTHLSLTMCPGTDVYMPPEAVEDKPVYNEKIDCFSFGVITLQILTQQFPKPGDRRQKVQLDHPGIPAGTLELRVSEVDRRQNDILLVDPSHPLLMVVFDCLKDNEWERPSARDLCGAIANLKENQEYIDSVRNIKEGDKSVVDDRDGKIKSLKEELVEQTHHLERVMNQLEERELTLSAMKEEIMQLDQRLQLEMQQKRAKTNEINNLYEQLKASNGMIAEFQRRFDELKPPPPIPERKSSKSLPRECYHYHREVEDNQNIDGGSMMLNWRVGESAPVTMCRWSDAVVTGNIVYFKNGYSSEIYAYDSVDGNWCQVVECHYQGCSLIMVNDMLTAVGGWSSNHLFSLLSEKDSDARAQLSPLDDNTLYWAEVFPPMPTKRCWTTCLSTESVLIVAGGEGATDEQKALRTVELMDTSSLQWSMVAGLPIGMKIASATLFNDRVYILGGKSSNGKSSTSAFMCSMGDLLRSSNNHLPSLDIDSTYVETSAIGQEDDSVWSAMANLPFVDCACVSLAGELLVIGGRSLGEDGYCSTAVNLYHSDTNTWEVISNMTIGRSSCFTAVLPGNQLMVVGGMVIGDLCTKTIKFATVV